MFGLPACEMFDFSLRRAESIYTHRQTHVKRKEKEFLGGGMKDARPSRGIVKNGYVFLKSSIRTPQGGRWKKVDLEKVIYKIRYLHHIFALLVVSWLGLWPDSSPVTGTHTPIESLSASRIDFLGIREVLYLNFLFLYSYRIDSEVEHNSVRGCWLHIKELYGQKLSVEKLCVCSSASSWPVIAEAKPPGCSPSDDDECPRRPSSPLYYTIVPLGNVGSTSLGL